RREIAQPALPPDVARRLARRVPAQPAASTPPGQRPQPPPSGSSIVIGPPESKDRRERRTTARRAVVARAPREPIVRVEACVPAVAGDVRAARSGEPMKRRRTAESSYWTT